MTVLLFHVLELIRAMLFVWWDTASIHREEPFIFSPYILRFCPGWGTKSLMHFSVWPGQIIYVPNSLIVMMPFPVSTITENISGRRHWNCYNNCIRIIMTTFPGTAWSFELRSCPKAQIKNPWSGEHHCALLSGWPRNNEFTATQLDRFPLTAGKDTICLFLRVVERPDPSEMIASKLFATGRLRRFCLPLGIIFKQCVYVLGQQWGVNWSGNAQAKSYLILRTQPIRKHWSGSRHLRRAWHFWWKPSFSTSIDI